MATVTIGGIPVFNALITDEDTGMFRISLVDAPAVMSDFQAFDEARRPLRYSIQDEEKRLVRGVVMRADFPIYRSDERFGEYYIIYKADQIRNMAEKYLLEARQNDVNLMHEGADVEGVQMVQCFIKDTAAGIAPEGFDDIADGSLFAEFHIVNDDIWAAIKEGTYKGFSLEGIFDLVPESDKDRVESIVDILDGAFSRIFNNPKNNTDMSKFSRFKAALAKALQEFGSVTTDKGVLVWDGEEDLMAGYDVFMEDADGNRTVAPDGEYVTPDNKTITVADGKVADIKDPEAEVAPEEPEEAPVEAGSVDTDKGSLVWEGEEDLKAGDPVFVNDAEGNLVPAPDGEYMTEDAKTIVVVDGAVAEIRDPEAEVAPADEPDAEVEALRAENAALKERVAELERTVEEYSARPAAKPAHEEVTNPQTFQATGNRRLDRLAKIMAAK